MRMDILTTEVFILVMVSLRDYFHFQTFEYTLLRKLAPLVYAGTKRLSFNASACLKNVSEKRILDRDFDLAGWKCSWCGC